MGEAGRAQVRMLHCAKSRPAQTGNDQIRYSYDTLVGSSGLELDGDGSIISMEEYYPYGGTAVWTARSAVEADYKSIRYSGKERDATGLYYYGYRYYQPWAGRWLSADPAGTIDGLNLFRMVRNNPVIFRDVGGMYPEISHYIWLGNAEIPANAVQDSPDGGGRLMSQNTTLAPHDGTFSAFLTRQQTTRDISGLLIFSALRLLRSRHTQVRGRPYAAVTALDYPCVKIIFI